MASEKCSAAAEKGDVRGVAPKNLNRICVHEGQHSPFSIDDFGFPPGKRRGVSSAEIANRKSQITESSVLCTSNFHYVRLPLRADPEHPDALEDERDE